MAGQTDSATTLNAGTGGDLIREVTITRDDGTVVRQQVVALADPINADNIAIISAGGYQFVRSDEIWRMLSLHLNELRLIRYAMGKLIGEALMPESLKEGELA